MVSLLAKYAAVRGRLIGLGALLVAAAVLETFGLVVVVPLAQAVSRGDHVITLPRPFSMETSATNVAIIGAIAVVLTFVVRIASAVIQARITSDVEYEQRQRVASSYLHASITTRSSQASGRLPWVMGLATGYADLLGVIASNARSAINVAIMLIVAVVASPLGALVIIGVGVLFFAGFRPLLRATRSAHWRALISGEGIVTDLAEIEQSSTEVVGFGVTAPLLERLADDTGTLTAAKRRAATLGAILAPLYQAVGMLIALGVLAYATRRSVNVALLGAVALLLLRSLTYAQGLQSGLHRFGEYRPQLAALESAIDDYEVDRVVDGHTHLDNVVEVCFDRVSHSYGPASTNEPPNGSATDQRLMAIRDVSFTVATGERVGLVGPSGAGKSTLAALLLRFRAPSDGSITVNGDDVATFSNASYAATVSFVPQRPLLMRGSVTENVRFLRRDVSDDQVRRAITDAGLDDVVAGLPNGVDTLLGANGHGLSGGQIQRIGIARALAGRPTLIVFDEPTSALDADNEAAFTAMISRLEPQVTVVLIAHRLSTLQHCTRVLVLDRGVLTADGPIDVISRTNPYFESALRQGAFRSETHQ